MGMLPQRKVNPVLECCRVTGAWQVMSRRGDWWYVTNTDDRRQHEIGVRYSDRLAVVKFSCCFPVRFSLRREPAGLCARMLMRSHDLRYAMWVMTISDSCEGQPYLFAQWPASALDTKVFDAICREMHNETEAFAHELRSKFRYAGVTVPPQDKPGVPALRVDPGGIEWVEDSK